MEQGPKKIIYLLCGWVSLGIGLVGIVVPLLPTTPLILVAAFCFSRGSQRMHAKLRENRIFGPMIRDWENHGAIARKAKVMATAMMVLMFAMMAIYAKVPLGLKIGLSSVGVLVLIFIWTRPSRDT